MLWPSVGTDRRGGIAKNNCGGGCIPCLEVVIQLGMMKWMVNISLFVFFLLIDFLFSQTLVIGSRGILGVVTPFLQFPLKGDTGLGFSQRKREVINFWSRRPEVIRDRRVLRPPPRLRILLDRHSSLLAGELMRLVRTLICQEEICQTRPRQQLIWASL